MKDFEKNLEKLEAISEKMRTESLPLDQAMKLFEEGTALVQQMDKEISKAERKVEKLLAPPTAADMQDPEPTEAVEETPLKKGGVKSASAPATPSSTASAATLPTEEEEPEDGDEELFELF